MANPTIDLLSAHKAHLEYTVVRKIKRECPSAYQLADLIRSSCIQFRKTVDQKFITKYDLGQRVRIYP